MKRALLAGIALLSVTSFAQEQAPCTAGLTTTKIVPCGAPLATIGDKALTAADLDEETRKKVAGLDAAVAAARKKALREEIDDTLLQLEAERRGVTLGRLLETEVLMKVSHPTDAEVAAEMASDPKKYKKGKEYEEWAAGILYDRRLKAREKQLVAQIEKRFPVAHADDPARAAVGKRKIDAALRMNTAEADVRVEVATAERDAIRRIATTAQIHVDVPQRPRQNIPIEHSPSTGPRDAKVTLVEFGDFECPPCGRMSRVVEEALQPYETRVRYVFRQFPLTMHPFAWKAAEAALAANAQGKFFPYERILFANQKQLDVASLKRYASEAGLDRKRFDDDLDSGRFARNVIEDKHDGARAGVRGTPMFFINGALLPDEGYSMEGMRKALESALGDRP
jgi:protein-disulfide isomerase